MAEERAPRDVLGQLAAQRRGQRENADAVFVGENDVRCRWPRRSRCIERSRVRRPDPLYIAPREGHHGPSLRHQSLKANTELALFERPALGRTPTSRTGPRRGGEPTELTVRISDSGGFFHRCSADLPVRRGRAGGAAHSVQKQVSSEYAQARPSRRSSSAHQHHYSKSALRRGVCGRGAARSVRQVNRSPWVTEARVARSSRFSSATSGTCWQRHRLPLTATPRGRTPRLPIPSHENLHELPLADLREQPVPSPSVPVSEPDGPLNGLGARPSRLTSYFDHSSMSTRASLHPRATGKSTAAADVAETVAANGLVCGLSPAARGLRAPARGGLSRLITRRPPINSSSAAGWFREYHIQKLDELLD